GIAHQQEKLIEKADPTSWAQIANKFKNMKTTLVQSTTVAKQPFATQPSSSFSSSAMNFLKNPKQSAQSAAEDLMLQLIINKMRDSAEQVIYSTQGVLTEEARTRLSNLVNNFLTKENIKALQKQLDAIPQHLSVPGRIISGGNAATGIIAK
ncbi:MAG: hypothetical protein ACJAZS_000413, partial [Alteromonas naphthalenivorans]